jgi:ectoine hydroxylase-related dioxygenase (phytanoyl-CoA dioxygenase family)
MKINKVHNEKLIQKIQEFYIPKEQNGVYCDSFSIKQEKEMKEFFDKFGFVVIENCLTQEECQSTLDEYFDTIEKFNNKFDRKNMETWSNWPKKGIEKYGQISRDPYFMKQCLRNRQNENIYKAFSILLDKKDLIVNHDRGSLFRPTEINSSWKTSLNLHLDMNPFDWLYSKEDKFIKLMGDLSYDDEHSFIFENNQICSSDGMFLQGVINLHDNMEEDGGYIVVPGFHHIFKEYFGTSKPDFDLKSFSFDKKDPIMKLSKRIAMKAGSVVIWNQMMPHGSAPNFSGNLRCAQFIRMFPMSMLKSEKQKKSRRENLKKKMEINNFSLEEITEIGKILFDLNE